MSITALFIDGENFINKLELVLMRNGYKRKDFDLSTVDYNNLILKPLQGIQIDKKIFYAAKLHYHKNTPIKSKQLISFQRKLRNTLVNQGFEFLIAGNVRGQKVGNTLIFKEKGVDVKIAVDLVSWSCDKKLSRAIICSSDSDLQPAIKEVISRNVEIIYLGFENQPNLGMSYTTDRTILFRNSEVLDMLKR